MSNIHALQDRLDAQTLHVMADDRDWLADLGRANGESRLLNTTHADARALVSQFRPDESHALTLPWAESHHLVRFGPRKVSVWSGPTFSGKTALLRQLMLHAMLGDPKNLRKTLFISLEEEPQDVWREFICMAAHTRAPEAQQTEYVLDLLEDRLYVFDSTEMVDPLVLMGIIRYAADKYGISHVVIDSLMRLQLRTDDFEGQRELGNHLGRTARASGCHIHLVAHPRKTQNSRAEMDLYDIRGAQDIVAQADLVLTLERQHSHEGIEADRCDSRLKVWKQRGDVNWIGFFNLYYHAFSRQLLYRPNNEPAKYVPRSVGVHA